MNKLEKEEKRCGCGTLYSEHGSSANGYCTPKQDIKGATGYGGVDKEECKCGHYLTDHKAVKFGDGCVYVNCSCKSYLPPHQEPVSTQKEERNKLTNITMEEVVELNKNGANITIVPTQEPMEEKWIEEFDNCIKFVGSPEQYYNNVKQFLSSQIKQAEERERDRIVKGIDELHENYCGTRDDTSVLYKGQGYCEAYDEAEEDIINIITNQ